MSNDITALALLVSKAKASVFTMKYISQFEASDIDSDDVDLRFEVDGVETGTNVSIVDECGQAAQMIMALVEALEKAQQPAEPFGFTDGDAHGMVYEPRHADRLANPCPVYRLPPLESKSRTVTVKLPSLKQPESGERYMWSDGVFNYRSDAIGILRAAGIQVIEGEG